MITPQTQTAEPTTAEHIAPAANLPKATVRPLGVAEDVRISAQEEILLQRMRWIDRSGRGCYLSLGSLAQGVAGWDRHKFSLSNARRYVARLRKKGMIVFAGQTVQGTNIYLHPDRKYKAGDLPICTSRPVDHLWSTEAAQRLVDQSVVIPPSLFVEGYRVPRRMLTEYSEKIIRRAIADIQQCYAGKMHEIRSQESLLRFYCRGLVGQQRPSAPALRSPETRAKDERRWEEMSPEIANRLTALLGGQAAQSMAAEPAGERGEVAELGEVGQLINSWLSDNQTHNSSTRSYHATKAANLVRFFGARSIASLNKRELAQYVMHRSTDAVKVQTIKKELALLRMILRDTNHPALFEETSVRRYMLSMQAKDTRKGRPLNFDEYQALRGVLDSERAAFLDLAVYAGPRRSEFGRIRVGDVDAKAGTLRIRGTKTRDADRVIPAHALVLELALGRKPTEPLVTPWHNAHRDLAKACELASIPKRSVVDLRHTFGSWLKRQGVESFAIAKLMGHRTSQMVEKHYAHLDPETLRASVDKLPTSRPPPTKAPQRSARTD